MPLGWEGGWAFEPVWTLRLGERFFSSDRISLHWLSYTDTMYLFLFALSLLNGFLVSTERPCSGLRLEGRLLRDKGLAVNILYKQLGHPKMGGPIILYFFTTSRTHYFKDPDFWQILCTTWTWPGNTLSVGLLLRVYKPQYPRRLLSS
jgi:hypothetical protein